MIFTEMVDAIKSWTGLRPSSQLCIYEVLCVCAHACTHINTDLQAHMHTFICTYKYSRELIHVSISCVPNMTRSALVRLDLPEEELTDWNKRKCSWGGSGEYRSESRLWVGTVRLQWGILSLLWGRRIALRGPRMRCFVSERVKHRRTFPVFVEVLQTPLWTVT